jgi:hypothetical protein
MIKNVRPAMVLYVLADNMKRAMRTAHDGHEVKTVGLTPLEHAEEAHSIPTPSPRTTGPRCSST